MPGPPCHPDEAGGDGRAQHAATHRGGEDRGEDVLTREVLEEVAVGAGLYGAQDVPVGVVGRQNHDAGRVGAGGDPTGGLDAIESGHVQVHEDDIGDELGGQGDIEAAATPSRQARGADVGIIGESHTIDGLGDVGGPSEEAGDMGDGLRDSEVLEIRGGLGDDTDAGAPGARGASEVLPQDGDGATSATAQPLEDLDDGGLACAVRPQEGDDGAG